MVERQVSDKVCPACGKPMLFRTGRFGPFLGCSDYPKCKTVMKIDKEGNILPPKPPAEPTGIRCYKCEKGELVIRQGRKGPFLGCNKFPRCRTIVDVQHTDKLKKLQEEGAWPPQSPEQAEELLGIKRRPKPARAAK